jgi:hypothetical protein
MTLKTTYGLSNTVRVHRKLRPGGRRCPTAVFDVNRTLNTSSTIRLPKPKKPSAKSLPSSTNTSAVNPGPFARKRCFLNPTNSRMHAAQRYDRGSLLRFHHDCVRSERTVGSDLKVVTNLHRSILEKGSYGLHVRGRRLHTGHPRIKAERKPPRRLCTRADFQLLCLTRFCEERLFLAEKPREDRWVPDTPIGNPL